MVFQNAKSGLSIFLSITCGVSEWKSIVVDIVDIVILPAKFINYLYQCLFGNVRIIYDHVWKCIPRYCLTLTFHTTSFGFLFACSFNSFSSVMARSPIESVRQYLMLASFRHYIDVLPMLRLRRLFKSCYLFGLMKILA